jgi:hypothetical protein
MLAGPDGPGHGFGHLHLTRPFGPADLRHRPLEQLAHSSGIKGTAVIVHRCRLSGRTSNGEGRSL